MKLMREHLEEIRQRIKSRYPLPSKLDNAVARHFIKHFRPHVRYWNGDFYDWTGTHYEGLDPNRLPADVACAYEGFPVKAKLMRVKADGKKETFDGLVPLEPSSRDVTDVVRGIGQLAHVDAKDNPSLPCWLNGGGAWPAHEMVAFRNGILHVPTRTFSDHTPNLFTTTSMPHDFDPNAREPKQWLAFLEQILPDRASVALLQEWFGYMLTPDTSLQKLMWIIGPKRSGKGTILRVLGAVVGENNVTAPKLGKLHQQFALSGLIGKSVALVGDSRLRRKHPEIPEILENLLSITGEDMISIDRKNRSHWTGRLSTRFTIASNYLPDFHDDADALMSRMLMLRLTSCFSGKEDPTLTDRLVAEAPQILNWAITGLERLRANGGRFTSNVEEVGDLIETTSDGNAPLKRYYDEALEYTGNRDDKINRGELFDAFQRWYGGDDCSIRSVWGLTRGLSGIHPGIRVNRKTDNYECLKFQKEVPF